MCIVDSMCVIVCFSIAANFQKLGSLTVPCLCTRNCSVRHVQLKAGHQAEHQEDGKQLGKQLEWGGKEACSKVGELLRSKARGFPEVKVSQDHFHQLLGCATHSPRVGSV